MNPSHTPPVNKDLAEQAHPGHGVPSQDPDAPAQFPLRAAEADREANSVLTGGGMVAGAATGATIGAVAAGPVGVLVGGSVGAVVGALGAQAAGAAISPDDVTRPHPASPPAPGVAAASSSVLVAEAPPITARHAAVPPASHLETENLDALGKDFGAFYPTGHVVMAFTTQADLDQVACDLKNLSPHTASPREVTSAEMIEFAERNIQQVGVLATLGTSVTTLQGFLEAAQAGAVFLIVPTPDDTTADQVTEVLRSRPHLLAERYRELAIETVVV